MNCGVPFCQSAISLKGMTTGCPLHNLIPEWNDEIYNKNYAHALSRLLKTNPFPEFTGRVCPALCEKACINGIDSDPVSVHDNELFIIETGFKNGYMQPKIPAFRSGKRIAVVGSGPSGLAAAYDLNQRGHNVTVFERDDKPGGLLMYGIPNMKLDKKFIQRRVDLMEQEGIEFQCSINIGEDVSMEDLLHDFDAVLLCCGSKQARSLKDVDMNTDGIYYAVDYLSSNTKHLLSGSEAISAKDKHVIIVGGGDTGNDCVGTAIRQQCAGVLQIEMMPKAPDTRLESNPWPEWPKVCKTDYGQEEAIAVFGRDPRIYESTISKIFTNEGKLCGVEIVKLENIDGRLVPVEGSQQVLECDLLLVAAGFTGLESYVQQAFDLEMTARNTILTPMDEYKTNQEKVFAAGDCRRGQSLVVWAIHEGKEAAKEIDEYLMGYTNMQ